eukprot:1155131-Pelagomonas_calceolata.AAC.2
MCPERAEGSPWSGQPMLRVRAAHAQDHSKNGGACRKESKQGAFWGLTTCPKEARRPLGRDSCLAGWVAWNPQGHWDWGLAGLQTRCWWASAAKSARSGGGKTTAMCCPSSMLLQQHLEVGWDGSCVCGSSKG